MCKAQQCIVIPDALYAQYMVSGSSVLTRKVMLKLRLIDGLVDAQTISGTGIYLQDGKRQQQYLCRSRALDLVSQ